MSGRRFLSGDALLWIAATIMLIFSAQRYFRANPLQNSGPYPGNSAVARRGNLPREAAKPRPGQRSTNPLQIPWSSWKHILWRTYLRSNQDRLLATAAGVVLFGLLALLPAITAL